MKNIHFAMYSISFFFLLVKFCIFKSKTLFYKNTHFAIHIPPPAVTPHIQIY